MDQLNKKLKLVYMTLFIGLITIGIFRLTSWYINSLATDICVANMSVWTQEMQREVDQRLLEIEHGVCYPKQA